MSIARRCFLTIATLLFLGCGSQDASGSNDAGHPSPQQEQCSLCPTLPFPCPSCPAQYAVTLFVRDAVDGGPVDGVTAKATYSVVAGKAATVKVPLTGEGPTTLGSTRSPWTR